MFEFLEAYENFANTTGIFAPFFRLLGLIPIIFLWFIILYPFYHAYKQYKLEQDVKKSQIETAKYLKILAENAQNQKENSQN